MLFSWLVAMHVGGCVCDLSKCQPRIPPVLFRALLALRALCIINYKQQWDSQGLLNMKLCHTVCVHRICRISFVLSFFFFKETILEDISPFLRVTDTPVLDLL